MKLNFTLLKYRSPNAAFLAQLKEESNTIAHSFLCIILKQGA
jgi:hypothetical protein